MKKTLLTILFLGALFTSTTSNAQARLYLGYRTMDSLAVVDTTGGLKIIEHRLLTTNFPGTISGCFGLSMHPTTGDMYILYDVGSNTTRRLGILDTLSGGIADIGMAGAGNLTDIEFMGNTLYGTTGSDASYDVVTVNLTSAATTTLVSNVGTYGPSVLHNTFRDSLYKFDRNQVYNINTTAGTATQIDVMNDEIHGAVMKNDSIAILANYRRLYSYNFNSQVYSNGVGDTLMQITTNDIHALEFGTPFSGVGIVELSADEQMVEVFPNPTADLLNIAFEGEFEFDIVNSAGVTVLSGIGMNTQKVSIKELAKGSYLVVTRNQKGKATAQVIKN